MMIDIFGDLVYVLPLEENMTIAGGRLYVLLKESQKEGKFVYEYLGSMMANMEDNTPEFMQSFFSIATHYALPPERFGDMLQLKAQLDNNDRGLFFEGKKDV